MESATYECDALRALLAKTEIGHEVGIAGLPPHEVRAARHVISRYGRKNGRMFETRVVAGALRIWRTR